MPELPEVETIVADLRPHLAGRTIVSCDLLFPSIVRHPEPEVFIDLVAGMQIMSVRRRGKYILIDLENDLMLVVHLGMTGQLRLVDADAPIEKHTHAIFTLNAGSAAPPALRATSPHGGEARPLAPPALQATSPLGGEARLHLRYRDPRRFGRLLLGTEESLLASKKLPRLGPEPIDPAFAAEELYRRLRKRRTALKAFLLNQEALAGVGNIDADESLRDSLLVAIANRGSSVDTYRDAWGEIGGQQERLLVYGRAGEPCFTCGRPLASIRIAGRSTVFCRRCQR